MKTSLNVDWIENMSFQTELNGHKIIIDAAPENGGNDKGPRPKALMLLALAGCTGMDVVSILKKMKVEYEKLSIEVQADATEEHPVHYTKMHVIYKVWGKDLPIDKIEKAVSLSDEKYCGVSAAYKKAMEMTHEIQVNP
ncbi:MAG: OsmC family protein [Bacteroidales bacterium]|jgi:putative redox protein|nr:OsmC family protein [Bacteroidales bacterium]